MRQKIIAANWKMNLNVDEAKSIAKSINSKIKDHTSENLAIVLFPPYIYLSEIKKIIDSKQIYLGAQNCHTQENGAFTGEISASMLASLGIEYVIIGHSERRQYFYEGDDVLRKKINITLKHNLKPIFCCGETLFQREQNIHHYVIENQLTNALFHLEPHEFKNMVIAYEPVWAIGTGKTASAKQAQEIHAFIRSIVAKKYGEEISSNMSILYGGSCKPNNAKELFEQKDIDGGLIGGASLVADDFIKIIQSTHN